jgi:DNA-binding GntR family transcriptional regulator
MPQMTFLDIKNRNAGILLGADLLSRLREDILTRKYKQGYKLTEQHICAEYGVSRTPVREALKQLEMEGLIEVFPNRGAFVVGFSEQDISDMYELRKSYEILAVKWAIERITDDELDALEETFEFMEFYTLKSDIEKMLHFNMNFHQLIYIASHNRILQNILSSYQLYIKYAGADVPFNSEYLPELLEEHRAIFNAFKNKDLDAGVKAIDVHLTNAFKRSRL